MAATPKKKTIDEVFDEITNFQKNIKLTLDGLQQNVNTVGEVAAGNSTSTSAGSALAGLGGDDNNYLMIALIVAGGYLAWKNFK